MKTKIIISILFLLFYQQVSFSQHEYVNSHLNLDDVGMPTEEMVFGTINGLSIPLYKDERSTIAAGSIVQFQGNVKTSRTLFYYAGGAVAICKKTGSDTIAFVLTGEGMVIEFRLRQHPYGTGIYTVWELYDETQVPQGASAYFQKIQGDALHVLNNGDMYVSYNQQTWQMNMSGIPGNENVSDFDQDSAQNIFCLTGQHLYWQDVDTGTWHQLAAASLPIFCSGIYVDKNNNLFIWKNGYSQLYRSSNFGASFTSTSFFPSSSGFMDEMIEDVYGTLYKLCNQRYIYRSTDGGQTWTDVALPLHAMGMFTANDPIKDFYADSLLYACTSLGTFVSNDQGNTWSDYILQGVAYQMLLGSDQSTVVATGLGIYHLTAGDSVWVKTFPTGNIRWKIQHLFEDTAGVMYAAVPTDIYGTETGLCIKSTDNGQSWVWDTATFNTLPLPGQPPNVFFVDEYGTQHLATQGQLPLNAPPIWTKTQGGIWQADTAGIHFAAAGFTIPGRVNCFTSDKAGNIFFSGTWEAGSNFPTTWTRSIYGGAWSNYSISLTTGNVGLNVLTSDNFHTLFGGTVQQGNWRNGAASWQMMSLPIGMTMGHTIAAYANAGTNSSNFMSFNYIDTITGNIMSHGLYCTEDNGFTWHYIGFDTVEVYSTFTFANDTSIAFTEAGNFLFDCNGLIIDTTGAIGISQLQIHNDKFLIYPNPANDELNFIFPNEEYREIKISNLQGIVVDEFVTSIRNPKSEIQNLTSGIYFVEVKSKNGIRTTRFVKQ